MFFSGIFPKCERGFPCYGATESLFRRESRLARPRDVQLQVKLTCEWTFVNSCCRNTLLLGFLRRHWLEWLGFSSQKIGSGCTFVFFLSCPKISFRIVVELVHQILYYALSTKEEGEAATSAYQKSQKSLRPKTTF